MDLPPGARIEVTQSAIPVRLARLSDAPFTDRLVAKVALPVSGWRGPAASHPTQDDTAPAAPADEGTE